MAATPSIHTSEAGVTVVAGVVAPSMHASVLTALSVYNFPTQSEHLSQLGTNVVVANSAPMHVSSLGSLAVVRGRVENRKMRCWTFSLDGHDFYVLRLGELETLVLDLATGQWSAWESPDLPFWRVQNGVTWLGMGQPTLSRDGSITRIVAGDDNFGRLWILDPEQGYDDGPREDLFPAGFTRKAVGGINMRLRETTAVGAVYLTANFGTPQITGASVTLRTSDDNGKTWTPQGTITVEPGNYDQEFVWRSIGLIRAPGKIFEISDNGATVRIDGLDMR